ncbi:MAG: methyltransferase [Thermoleophilia bacterium]
MESSPGDTTAAVDVLEHQDGLVRLVDLGGGRRLVEVEVHDPVAFVPSRTCETGLPLDLIRAILDFKGPSQLCYSLRREEDPLDVQVILRYAVHGYVGEEAFAGARLLDFGCGSGASTMILARAMPDTEIVGIDLGEDMLAIAQMRAAHYGLGNVTFLQSPDPDGLPPGIGLFDYVSLSAVFEHMLPRERVGLLPQIWGLLRQDGILFLNQTPHRYYPIEGHTTGLPLVNYLPDSLARLAATRISGRVPRDAGWDDLLRAGLRGGTEREVMGILRGTDDGEPTLLAPSRLGLGDRVDIWYAYSTERRPSRAKRVVRPVLKALGTVLGEAFAPDLNMAIQKR